MYLRKKTIKFPYLARRIVQRKQLNEHSELNFIPGIEPNEGYKYK